MIEANFLQPVIEIRQPPGSWRLDNAHITPLALEEKEPRLFVGEFKAGASGELFVFANDAVSLLDPTYFYTSRLGKNHGKRDAQDRAARGGPDSVDRHTRGPGTRRQLIPSLTVDDGLNAAWTPPRLQRGRRPGRAAGRSGRRAKGPHRPFHTPVEHLGVDALRLGDVADALSAP